MKTTIHTHFLQKTVYALLALLFSVSVMHSPAYADVKATLNQKSYYLGDIINLRIETDKNQNQEPDLSILQNNFDIKGTSASSQINIINGRRSYKKTWSIELQAKATGQLTIPEITLGDEKTEAIEISVNNIPPEVVAETSKHIFIEAAVDIPNDEIYVQQQIPYNVKFYYDSAMRTGEVILPTIESANIRVVGREKKYQVQRAGNNYVVVDRRYVISPEKSGELIIPPTIVQGRMALTGGDSPELRKRKSEVDLLNELFFDFNGSSTFSNPFDPFFSRRSIGPTRPYTANSEAIKVNVLPVPDSFTGSAWLPAEEIIMQDSWTKNPPTFTLGEPVTRNIIMQVKGLASSQIPEIDIPKPEGVKAYPEQTKTETPDDGNTIYGLQRVDITYIPEKLGQVIIPEINVDWWDVNNKKQQTYTLPEWNLQVAAGAGQPKPNQIATEAEEVFNDTDQETEIDNLTDTETLTEDASSLKLALWNWQSIVGFVALILASLWVLFRLVVRFNKSAMRSKSIEKNKQRIDVKTLKHALLKACKANENHVAAALLIKYSRHVLNDYSLQNLGAIQSNLKEGAEIVKALEASLYASNKKPWNGDRLYKLISQGLSSKNIKKTHTELSLAPLYPNQ